MSTTPARLVFPFLVALATMLAGCDNADSVAIREAFDTYNDALNRADGAAFLRTIDPDNVGHHDLYVRSARSATKQQIQRLGLYERFYILKVRHRFSTEEIKSLDGAALIRACVEQGWFVKEKDGEEFTLGHITLKPPRASAPFLINGKDTGRRFEFVNVGGTWLANDECMNHVLEERIRRASTRADIPEDELLFWLEERSTGRPVDPAIFDAPPK